jgi:hypothetical protein
MVIDHKDANFSNEIIKMGITTYATDILMNSLKEEKRLAKFILKVMNC